MHIAHALHTPQQGLHGCYAEVSTFIEEVGTETSNSTHSACRPTQFACTPMQGVARRAAVRRLTDEQTASLFAAIDVDGSGAIELSELMAFGRAIGAGWSREACVSLLGKMDSDGDLAISLQEFRAFVSEVAALTLWLWPWPRPYHWSWSCHGPWL